MIETAVLALFALAMMTLAAALWRLTAENAAEEAQARGGSAARRG